MKEVGSQACISWLWAHPAQGNNPLLGGDPGWSLMSWVQVLMRDSGHTHSHVPLPGPLHKLVAAIRAHLCTCQACASLGTVILWRQKHTSGIEVLDFISAVCPWPSPFSLCLSFQVYYKSGMPEPAILPFIAECS